ncbi:hypothetical protein FACS189440_22010 [Bacteroidia bacterium]|nr:hypothetical protein FACS189440_22010 [Bacteroidia bacterium]
MNSKDIYFGLVMRIYDDWVYLERNASRRPAFNNDVAGTLRQTGVVISNVHKDIALQ